MLVRFFARRFFFFFCLGEEEGEKREGEYVQPAYAKDTHQCNLLPLRHLQRADSRQGKSGDHQICQDVQCTIDIP